MTRTVTNCGVCDSPDLRPVLDLGASPPTCAMPKIGERPATEGHHPLTLLFCDRCGLAQLSVIVDPEVLFPLDFPYSSGNSKGLHANFEDLERHAVYGPDDLVVDIGANDGTLLSKFNCRRVGVEPTSQAEKIDAEVCNEFFDEDTARWIVKEHGKAKIVTACNVLAHVDDIHETMRGIKTLLADDGVLIAENHDLASVVDGQWDTVYHEHLRVYSPSSFRYLLNMHGLEVREWQNIPTHGGSFRATAALGDEGIKPEPVAYDFAALSMRATHARQAIRDVADWIPAIGATARATTLINFCGLDTRDIYGVYEVPGSDKIGRTIPGTNIPVFSEDALFEGSQPRKILLLSWHLADSIVPKLRERGYKGTVVVPLPSLRFL